MATVKEQDQRQPALPRLCAVCGNKMEGTFCTNCGFDSSRDYENFPTVQLLPEDARAISCFKKKLRPSAADAISLLRNQGWDEHVLKAVQKLLQQAEAGNFTPQHDIEIRKQGWDNQIINIAQKVLNKTESTIFPQQYNQKNNLPPTPTAVPPSASTSIPKAPVILPKVCSLCGTSNDPNRLYCESCGAKLPNNATKK